MYEVKWSQNVLIRHYGGMTLNELHARRGGVEVADWTVDEFDSLHTLIACGTSDDKEVKDVFGRSSARVGVGSARLRPLAAHGVMSWQQVWIWRLDNCPVTI